LFKGYSMYTTLISAPELQALMAGKPALMVFDCSFELMQATAGDTQYQQAHIAGAVRADLDRHLSAHGDVNAASGGRHPLPSREAFATWLGRVGLTPEMQVVVYDRQGCHYCGRLWWMLKWAGHEASAVLDGGLAAWQAINGRVESGAGPSPHATYYPLAQECTALVDTEVIAKQLGRPGQTLIDARGAPRFRGEVEPLDPVAGHIPGALNRPFTDNFDATGKFKSATQLRTEFETLLAGRDPRSVVNHCGSGVTAVPNIIAMEVAGLGRSGLYAGSWSDWCSDPTRPCAKG
jgi:thiosulfate/3-mercaptopyruvate sulfurtransferase